jgi:hypothetical protein
MKKLAMLFSLLVVVAFAGGYLLATANARVTCETQSEESASGIPAMCADISSTGVTTALFFGIAGLVVWAAAWFVFGREGTRSGV